MCRQALACSLWLLSAAPAWAQAPNLVPNPSFEADADADGTADGWILSVNGGPKSTATLDDTVAHEGRRSLRLTSDTPLQPFVWTAWVSGPITVEPGASYAASVWVRAERASQCYLAASFASGGEHRLYLPSTVPQWRRCSSLLTVPPDCGSLTMRIACDDVTASLWADDVSLEELPLRLSDLTERREPRPFDGVFPRTPSGLPERLCVFDATKLSNDERIAVTALQGLANRDGARLYVVQPTNPPRHDELWLDYMRACRYTGAAEWLGTLDGVLARFENEVAGLAIWDPELPDSIHAACMLAGLDRVLPVSPELAAQLNLPVVHDLRGRWTRNVDAIRSVVDPHWDRMNHHVLAWLHPAMAATELDYRVQHRVPTVWQSSYADALPGADPADEERLVHELLGRTPANIPVMGWPSYGEAEGLTEYQCVRLCSEYGKFLPGLGCSNLSVHTAIRPDEAVFAAWRREAAPRRLDPAKAYVALSVLESGDALWYWQLRQRQVWDDPARGSVPIGWSINPTLCDAMPVVAQWFCESATGDDTFFAAVSGLGYMLAPYYAARFTPHERERIWAGYASETAAYCRRMGLDGVELHTDGASPDALRPTLQRLTGGIDGLRFILNDFTRFPAITAANANYIVDSVPVLHTLTRFKPWALSTELAARTQDTEVAYMVDEIRVNTPTERPAFVSAMVTSWTFTPTWIADLATRLGPDYEVVSAAELAELVRQWGDGRGARP